MASAKDFNGAARQLRLRVLVIHLPLRQRRARAISCRLHLQKVWDRTFPAPGFFEPRMQEMLACSPSGAAIALNSRFSGFGTKAYLVRLGLHFRLSPFGLGLCWLIACRKALDCVAHLGQPLGKILHFPAVDYGIAWPHLQEYPVYILCSPGCCMVENFVFP